MASLHLRRLVPAVLLAATATLAGSAVGDPAAACAEPREWDLGEYDDCLRRRPPGFELHGAIEVWDKNCCEGSGGIWDAKNTKCVAPPAEPAEAQPGVAPGTAPGVATENPAPPLPPIRNPEITATFQPGPVGPVG